jgi:hypothetical protein
MPFSFPSSPTVGQQSTQNGRSFTYAGNNTWELTPASGGGSGSLSGSVTIPGLGDQSFSSVSLLLHMDGSGSTFVDNSGTPKTVTAYGNATQSTAQSKFGGKGAYFDGTGDYIQLSTQNQSSLQFSTQPHTVEFWFKTASTQQYTCLFYRGRQDVEATYDYVLNINNASASAGDLTLYSLGFGGVMGTSSGGWNDDQWHHVAVVRDAGNVFRIYVDGVQQATRTYDMTQSHSNSSDSIIRIGKDGFHGRDYTGYIDELRISTICRYPSGTSFTPSSTAFFDGTSATFPVTVTGSGGGGGTDSRWNLFLPPAPTSVTPTGGSGQVSITWSAPTVLAQTPITDYVVQYSTDSGSTWTTFSDGTSTSTSATVTGLTNGTAYVFRVAAVNGVGTGAYSTATSSLAPGNVFRAIPTMTSTTSPSGVVTSTSGGTDSGYESWMAFDGNNSTFPYFSRAPSNTPRRTLGYAFPDGQKSSINGYSIRCSTPFSSDEELNEWQFHGSDDGSNWDLLDTQTSQVGSWSFTGTLAAARTFTLSSTANYRYYRWTFAHNDNQGSGPAINVVQLVQ